MRSLWIIIPAAITHERDLEALRALSVLRDRLRDAIGGRDVKVYSALAMRRVRPRFDRATLNLGFNGVVWPADLRADYGRRSQCPVRHATGFLIEEFRRVLPSQCRQGMHVLRILQDVAVTDVDAFARDVREGLSASNDFVGGRVRPWSDEDSKLPVSLGLAPPERGTPCLSGEVLFAPLRVWERRYLRLPDGASDRDAAALTGAWVAAAGGKLVAMTAAWRRDTGGPVTANSAPVREQRP